MFNAVKQVAMLCLHTSPLIQPGSGDAGGMNVYVNYLAKHLGALDTVVDVFTRSEDDQVRVVHPYGNVRVIHLPIGVGLDKYELAELHEEFAEAISSWTQQDAEENGGGYDLIHSHYWVSALVGADLAERWEVPHAVTMHTLGRVKNASLAPEDTPEPRLRIDAERRVLAQATRITVNTAAERQDTLSFYGMDPEKIEVVPPGVDLDTFHPDKVIRSLERRTVFPAHHRIRNEDTVVLFAGRIQRLKGPQVLVAAMEHLPESIKLVLVGAASGPGEFDLDALITASPAADRIHRVPPQDPDHLARWYGAADIVAVPSYAESFGLVALEAQACGTPVIAADVSGLAVAVQDKATGLLVEGHDPLVWAQAILSLAENPGRRAALGQAAAEHARSYGWRGTALMTSNCYERMSLRTPTRL